jgi:hypothetical protein
MPEENEELAGLRRLGYRTSSRRSERDKGRASRPALVWCGSVSCQGHLTSTTMTPVRLESFTTILVPVPATLTLPCGFAGS